MLIAFKTKAARFYADDPNVGVIQEWVEQAQSVGATADASHQRVRQATFAFQHLLLSLRSDNGLEIADHSRVGVWSGSGTDDVESVFDVGYPVAQRLVHRVFQRPGTRGHRHNLSTQKAHAEHVRCLTLNVGRTHVDGTGQAKQRANRCRCNTVLTRAGFGNDAGLSHATGKQDLSQTVVDLVRAGVVQLVALEVDFCTTQLFGQPLGKVQRAWATDVVLGEHVELFPERRIWLCSTPFTLQIKDQRHQGFGDKTSTKNTEQTTLVRTGLE